MNHEDEIREALNHGLPQQALTVALQTYGLELLSYLRATCRSTVVAEDVFSCCDMWTGLASFRGEAPFRTWAYAII